MARVFAVGDLRAGVEVFGPGSSLAEGLSEVPGSVMRLDRERKDFLSSSVSGGGAIGSFFICGLLVPIKEPESMKEDLGSLSREVLTTKFNLLEGR